MDASIEALSKVEDIIFSKSAGIENTPASNQYVITHDRYLVQSSISFHSGGAATAVTADGYQVQTGVQSTLFKKE